MGTSQCQSLLHITHAQISTADALHCPCHRALCSAQHRHAAAMLAMEPEAAVFQCKCCWQCERRGETTLAPSVMWLAKPSTLYRWYWLSWDRSRAPCMFGSSFFACKCDKPKSPIETPKHLVGHTKGSLQHNLDAGLALEHNCASASWQQSYQQSSRIEITRIAHGPDSLQQPHPLGTLA